MRLHKWLNDTACKWTVLFVEINLLYAKMINNDPRHILSFFEEEAEDRINISVIDWQFLVILILIHVNEHYSSMKLCSWHR